MLLIFNNAKYITLSYSRQLVSALDSFDSEHFVPRNVLQPRQHSDHILRATLGGKQGIIFTGRGRIHVSHLLRATMTLRSILIVDDESNQRLMVEQALRALAYDWLISTAASGREALEALALSTPDLIITDYHMPTMNGLELIKTVRARQIPSRIILMTAYSSPEIYDEAERLKVDHYLTKPVPLNALRRLATAALEGDTL